MCFAFLIFHINGSNYFVLYVISPHSAGFEASAVLPTIPRRLPASSGVRLHSSHATLSAHLHHDLYRPPQVRGTFREK